MKMVFNYRFIVNHGWELVKGFEVVDETENHVCVKRWYGYRWYPKGNAWRVEANDL